MGLKLHELSHPTAASASATQSSQVRMVSAEQARSPCEGSRQSRLLLPCRLA